MKKIKIRKGFNKNDYARWRGYALNAPMPLDTDWQTKLNDYNKQHHSNDLTKEMSGQLTLTEDIVLSSVVTSGYYCERIREIMPSLPDVQMSSLTNLSSYHDLLQAGFQAFNKAIDTPPFSMAVAGIFGRAQADCKERTAILIAMFLKLLPQLRLTQDVITISYQVGVVFHSKYAPKGTGHAWAKLGDNIIESSIVPDGQLKILSQPFEGYIPVGMHQVKANLIGRKVEMQPFICAVQA